MSEVFLKIVNMSISASYLVLAVLILRLILKKAPKWVSVLLWGLVALRLICPISLQSALSLIPDTEPVREQVIASLVADTQTELPPSHVPANDSADTPVRDDIGDQAVTNVTLPEKQGIPAVAVLTAVWTAGVAGMIAYTAVSYFLLRRKVATAIRLENNIYRSENVDSPFVLGFVGPKIYLPFDMNGKDLAHVIAHEKAHIRRKDHWWKPVGFVLLAIHWFNPLMWVGYILLCRDIELACDEKVIKEMDNETKATYSEALVACSVNRRVIAACPLAFGEVGVKERVKTVMNYKKPAFWIVIAAIALCIVVAVCFLTDPLKANNDFDASLLEYPGLKWGMTPEQVKTSLNITDDQIIAEQTREPMGGYEEHAFSVKDVDAFGAKVGSLAFYFVRYADQEFSLHTIRLIYTDDTDMTVVRDNLVEIYGKGYDRGLPEFFIHNGEIHDQLLNCYDPAPRYGKLVDGQIVYEEKDPTLVKHGWHSTVKGTDVYSRKVIEAIVDEYANPERDESWRAERDVVLEFLDTDPLVVLTCMVREAKTESGEPTRWNQVTFTARYIATEQRYGQQ